MHVQNYAVISSVAMEEEEEFESVILFLQVLILLSGLAVIGLYWKRRVWSVLKSRKIVYYSKDTKP